MYLFDTDAVSNIFKKRPSAVLIRKLDELAPDEQFISSITVAEMVYGARKSNRPDFHLKNLERVLLTMATVLDFDVRAAYIAGQIRADLEKQGMPLSWPDIQIGAIAVAHKLTLITGNDDHFARIPSLNVENWLV
jgi:tRNA(fMet)-specific endonuclease VapC